MSDLDIRRLRDDCAALARRIDILESRESITRCIYQAARAIDRLDRPLLAAQFHTDAEVDYGVIYKGAISGFLDITMQFQGGMRDTQHIVGNVDITLDVESATTESYVYAHHVIELGETRNELIVGGRYLDRFERRDGKWKILFRTEVLDWARNVPIGERWFEDNNELPKGRRGHDDPSYLFLPPKGR